jgi:hypothetical protein
MASLSLTRLAYPYKSPVVSSALSRSLSGGGRLASEIELLRMLSASEKYVVHVRFARDWRSPNNRHLSTNTSVIEADAKALSTG